VQVGGAPLHGNSQKIIYLHAEIPKNSRFQVPRFRGFEALTKLVEPRRSMEA